MMYKKNILIVLFLTTIFLQNSLKCMFQRATSYAAKYIPAILKRLNGSKAKPAVPAGHIISNVDRSPVSQTQFNEIKAEILRPNEFPTALKNPDYNPDADETKVIQQKLDEKYTNDLNNNLTNKLLDPFNEYSIPEPKKTTVQWIPQTLHDLFTYKHSENEHDEYKVNQAIHDYLLKNPKKLNESDVEYYQRLAEPLIEQPYCNIFNINENSYFQKEKVKNISNAIKNTIAIETDQHQKNATKTLLYRGASSNRDFNTRDAYEVGKNGPKAEYAKKMATSSYYGMPITLSYGLSLLSNAKHSYTKECPFEYAFRKSNNMYNEENDDLQVLPVAKKEFNHKNGLWYVNPDFDYHKSMHADGLRFHPRSKGHTTAAIFNNNKYYFSEMFFSKNDPRIILHDTEQEAFNKYAILKKYQINNAIGVTDYTQSKIEEAKSAYEKGISDRNTSLVNYIYSFFGYKTKRDQK